ncbi:sulfatase [Pontiella desulfatans]|nr:sulfatase [Pontiella desulfatans]
MMIVLDDMNDWLGVMGGHPQAKTPNMDRLASEGVLFLNAHANVGVCSPSRASFMSGVHPLSSGCWGFNNPLQNEVLNDSKNLPELARENGFKAYQTGKVFHHVPQTAWTQKGIKKYHGPMAWDGQKVALHPSCPETMAELGALDSTYASLSDVPSVGGYTGWWDSNSRKPFRYVSEDDRDLMTDEQSVEWFRKKMVALERNKNAEPFMMAFGIMRPHTPLVVPQTFFDQFTLEDVQLPVMKKDDIDDLPWGEGSRGRQTIEALRAGADDPELEFKKYVQAYLASVAFADDIVGQTLAILDGSRFKENTVVVLFSDHGYNIGEKEYLWKYNLWEESTRVPLIIRDSRYAASAGKTVGHPVSLIDVFPTITDLCGITGETVKGSRGAPVDGHSLRPFLEHPQTTEWDGPDAALSVIASWKSQKPVDQHLSIRTKDWRYTRYEGGGEELYDHRNDPNEWNNLAHHPEYDAIKVKLAAQMNAMVPKTTPKANVPKQETAAKTADELWKDKYFGWHPDADTDNDGELSWEEYKTHKTALDAKKAGSN